MNTPPLLNQPADPEAEPTMRALDPFFETRDGYDHANQWQITTIWSDETPPPQPAETDPH